MPRPAAPTVGRVVGLLTLGDAFVGTDGARWVEARCACGSVTAVRSNHVAPGARKPTRSCGCLRDMPRVCMLGMAVGDDRVILDDGADHLAIACPQGHTWVESREGASGRASRGRRVPSDRSRTACEVCGTGGTINLTGEVFGLLTVIGRGGSDAPADGRYSAQATWRVRCACGVEKAVRGSHLRHANVRSCGSVACVRRLRGEPAALAAEDVRAALIGAGSAAGCVTRAAAALGVSRTTLHSWIVSHAAEIADIARPSRGRPRLDAAAVTVASG